MNDIDLSEEYERDLPKRGRPTIYFPSGLSRKKVAEGLGVCKVTVGKWCTGLPVPPDKQKDFYILAGFESEEQFQQWVDQPDIPLNQIRSQSQASHDHLSNAGTETNQYPERGHNNKGE